MTAPRLRRSSNEVRQLILDSARTLFGSQGYEATSTREIIEHAGVAESMLFRHFGSKKGLYDEAMLKPFAEFVQMFVDDWGNQPAGDVVPQGLAYRFVAGFSKLCADNLDLIDVLAEKNVGGESSPVASHVSALMHRLVDTLTKQVKTYHFDVGLDFTMDPRLEVRLTIALIVGAAKLGEDFIGKLDDHLIAEMAAFVVRGAGYPGDGRVKSANTASRKRRRRSSG